MSSPSIYTILTVQSKLPHKIRVVCKFENNCYSKEDNILEGTVPPFDGVESLKSSLSLGPVTLAKNTASFFFYVKWINLTYENEVLYSGKAPDKGPDAFYKTLILNVDENKDISFQFL